LHRLCKLPLDKKNNRRELDIIIKIAISNGYRKEAIIKLHNRIKTKTQQNNKADEINSNQKWVTFTYTGNYIRKITKLFKNTNIKMSFRTNNTINRILGNNYEINKYNKSGIYKLTCQTCQKVYIGQKGRNLNTRFKEHIRNICFNKDKSAYAQHILNRGHQYGPIEQVMKIVEQARKGGLMNIKENYYIYKFERRKELIEEQEKNKKEKGKDNQSFPFDIVIKMDNCTQRNDVGGRRIYKQTTQPVGKAGFQHPVRVRFYNKIMQAASRCHTKP
jgi:hypothetical protein